MLVVTQPFGRFVTGDQIVDQPEQDAVLADHPAYIVSVVDDRAAPVPEPAPLHSDAIEEKPE